jgi:Tfp pilus assembly protein PilV
MVNRFTRQGRDRPGVILVDILVATIILGVSLMTLISMTGRAMASQRQGQQLQTAAMLLDAQLSLVLAFGPDDYGSKHSLEGPCEPPFENFRYQIEMSGGQSGDAYRVLATVTWMDGGRPQSASVETMIAARLGDDPDPDRRPEVPAVRGY